MRMALKNSLFFMIFSAVTQQIIGVLLAVMLTNIRRGRNFFRNVIYLPTVLSSAALGLLWAFIFNRNFDSIYLLDKIGNTGTFMADGIRRFYCSSYDRDCFCSTLAICGTEYDVIYGSDYGHF